LNRPDANVTGATFCSGALGAKQMGVLKELAPRTENFGLLVKAGAASGLSAIRDTQVAAKAIGMELTVLSAASERDIEIAFTTMAERPNAALLVSVDPFFDSRSKLLVDHAWRHRLPTAYYLRDFVQDGGLFSYGASIADAYRQAGLYAGRLLKGAKPSDLPIQIPTRFELVINLKTAKALNLNITQTLLACADEVIE
jgi:putative ABC transport system substrate-binding protein